MSCHILRFLIFELIREVENYTSEISNFAYPVDGLVLTLNNIEHAESLGATLRYPRHSIAFKWPDEVKLTKVTGMKWSVSKTGLITPVVIFETIELEGTKVNKRICIVLRYLRSLVLVWAIPYRYIKLIKLYQRLWII